MLPIGSKFIKQFSKITLTPEAFQEKKPEHLKLKSLWGMCTIPIAKRRRGGVRQRQRDKTPSHSD